MFKKIIKNPFLWAFIIGAASLHLFKELSLRSRRAPDPMVLVPSWELINHKGESVSKESFLGKVVIADFFFTSCPSVCPKLTAAMKEVYHRFKDKTDQVQFLSITVDPETDTPDLLSRFMQENEIGHQNWQCLTGTKQAIYQTIVEKMRIHVGEREELLGNEGKYDIPHLAHLALFDQQGDLRGLFKTDGTELAALVRAANFLLEKR